MPDFQLKIDEKTIEKQIQELVHAQVISVLNDKSSVMMDQFVNSVLNQKVDSYGKPSNYSYGQTFMQWVAQEGIKKSIEEASKEWVVKQQPEIKRRVKSKLDETKPRIMDEIVDQIVNSLSQSFCASVTIRVRNDEE